jgi:catechol 2,3-dioxygenase-like lactoylglutathione lyase family enzyme
MYIVYLSESIAWWGLVSATLSARGYSPWGRRAGPEGWNPMPRLTHIALPVRNLGESVDFYRRYCRLGIVKDRRGEGQATVWLGKGPQSGAVMLVLQQVAEIHPHQLVFQLESEEEMHRVASLAHAEKAVSVYPLPVFSGEGIGSFIVVRDPSGHELEFIHGIPLRGLG